MWAPELAWYMQEISTDIGEEDPETTTLEHDDSWVLILIPIPHPPIPNPCFLEAR